MEVITDIKSIYPIFKMFKDIYTRVKISNFYLNSEDSHINLFFSENPYYLLSGEIINEDNLFLDWIKKDKRLTLIDVDILKELKSTLKKDIKSVEFDSDIFIFKTENNEYKFKKESEKNLNLINKIESINSRLIKEDIIENLSDDLLKLFIKDNKVVEERTEEKLIEIPISEVKSIQSKENNAKIRYSELNKNRYIEISSIKNSLILRQYFLTI